MFIGLATVPTHGKIVYSISSNSFTTYLLNKMWNKTKNIIFGPIIPILIILLTYFYM